MHKRIYIIGPCGSGKTTFATKLSKKYNINYYELDKVIWDDDNGNIKRTDKEVDKMFNDILKNKSWIIEDVGRDKFKKGRKKADIIYYIKMNRFKGYYRVVKRWIKQKIGIERYNHYPDLKQLKYFISIVNMYYKGEKDKLKILEEYKNKIIFVNKRKIKKIIKEEVYDS